MLHLYNSTHVLTSQDTVSERSSDAIIAGILLLMKSSPASFPACSQQLKSFNLRPTLVDSLCNDSKPPKSSGDSSPTTQRRRGGGTGGEDWLSSLPYEVLCHMASFLDSLSLSQLALVSRLMRLVCSSLLRERGMVTLRWERKTYSHGGAKWKAKPVRYS